MCGSAPYSHIQSAFVPQNATDRSAPAYAFSITYEAEGEEPIDGLTLPSYSEEVPRPPPIAGLFKIIMVYPFETCL